jgi:hypothetical protein
LRFREKLLILFLAVVLSFLGFYLISSPFAEFLALANETDTATTDSFLARYDRDKSMQANGSISFLSDSSFMSACSAIEWTKSSE